MRGVGDWVGERGGVGEKRWGRGRRGGGVRSSSDGGGGDAHRIEEALIYSRVREEGEGRGREIRARSIPIGVGVVVGGRDALEVGVVQIMG